MTAYKTCICSRLPDFAAHGEVSLPAPSPPPVALPIPLSAFQPTRNIRVNPKEFSAAVGYLEPRLTA